MAETLVISRQLEKIAPMKTLRSVVLIAWIGVVAAGCRTPQSVHLSTLERQTIQDHTSQAFDHVVLFKPQSGGDVASPFQSLAPLLIQQVEEHTTNNSTWADRPEGTDAAPVLFAERRITLIQNRWHWQYLYVWRYADSRQTQGVRITLNSRDMPVIWEILDRANADVVYVAKSLEVAAQIQFGPPLPDRRFSIERATSEAPATVVANAIEDGPVPMGPILYLQQSSREISALICRCMPAQFKILVDQQDYQLQLSTNLFASHPTPKPLEQRLRLPTRF